MDPTTLQNFRKKYFLLIKKYVIFCGSEITVISKRLGARILYQHSG